MEPQKATELLLDGSRRSLEKKPETLTLNLTVEDSDYESDDLDGWSKPLGTAEGNAQLDSFITFDL